MIEDKKKETQDLYPGDFHNSHNRVNDWINNNPDQK
jgi:hypothetical protein